MGTFHRTCDSNGVAGSHQCHRVQLAGELRAGCIAGVTEWSFNGIFKRCLNVPSRRPKNTRGVLDTNVVG